ncbi:hypothetical protein vseg_010270 [Gypsophila vaccaria]
MATTPTTLTSCAIILYLLSFLTTTTTTTTAAQAVSGNRTAFFIFGDSLYDSGMTFHSGVKGAGAEFWPYGFTFFNKPAGRYCDGRVIPDLLAEYAGLPFPEPYLNPELKDYTNGVSFAAAAACALVELRPSTLHIKRQMKFFKEMISKLKEQVGEEEANKVLSKAVYLINIGANDYVTLYQNNLGKTIPSSKKTSLMNHVIGNITLHIKAIYKLGGRKFAFQNIGPLGCVPSMKYMLGFKGACHPETLDIAKVHNAAFDDHLKQLDSQLPGFKYSLHDFHGSAVSRFQNGPKYGFKETQMGCCGSGDYNGDFSCQKKSKSFSVCSNPNDFLWFDAAHPTDKANQQYSKEFWSGSSDVVSPINLQTLFAL